MAESTGRKAKTTAPKSLIDKIRDEPVKVVYQMIAATDKVLQPRVATWTRYRRKYRRGLNYLRFDNGRRPLYFTNYIFAIVEVLKAHLTRNLPATSIRAKGTEADQVAATLIGRVVRSELLSAGIKRRIQACVQHAVICGLGWLKVGFDPAANFGAGGLAIDALAPEDGLVDPLAVELEDARWFIHRHRDVPLSRIYATYGKVPDFENDKASLDNAEGVAAYGEGFGYGDRSRIRPASEVDPVVDVYEVWVRNYDLEPEEDDEESDEPAEPKRKWYILTIADKTVVRDLQPSPYEHDELPFVALFDVEDSSAESLYLRGVGEVEEIEPLQDRADALDERIYQTIALTTNRQRYVSTSSGLTAASMHNTPGHSWSVTGDPSKAVYYDNPPILSRDVYLYRDTTEQLIQVVSGMFDALQGRRPVGIVAGKAVQNLQEAAATRVIFKVDSLAETLKTIFKLAAQIVLQFYDGQRIIQLTDADEDVTISVLDDYPEVLWEASPEERLRFKQENGIDLVLSDINFYFDIEVDGDSALPSSRVDRAQTALDLFRLGAIDRKALLDTMDFPNRHEILKRLDGSITGKNAGDPGAENDDVLQQVAVVLQQMGMDEQMIMQVLQAVSPGGQQQPQPGEGIPPQVAM